MTKGNSIYYSAPDMGVQNIVMSVYVCVCVCLSVCDYVSGTTHLIFTKFSCMLPVAAVADPGFLQGGCGSWCLRSAPSPFMPSLSPTLKKISWELAAR